MLALAAALSPLIAWQVHVALGSNSNDVRDWLPAEYPETAEYHAFFHRFGSEDFVAASWPGCQLDDPRLERFAERLRTPGRERLIKRVVTGSELVQTLQESPIGLNTIRPSIACRGAGRSRWNGNPRSRHPDRCRPPPSESCRWQKSRLRRAKRAATRRLEAGRAAGRQCGHELRELQVARPGRCSPWALAWSLPRDAFGTCG